MDKIKTKNSMVWTYQTKEYVGRCRLAKETTEVSARFFLQYDNEFPDVCVIEKWFREKVESELLSVEELADACRIQWGMSVEVTQKSHLHGPIVVRCNL